MKYDAFNKLSAQYHALVDVVNEVEQLLHLINLKHLGPDLPKAIQAHLFRIEARLRAVE